MSDSITPPVDLGAVLGAVPEAIVVVNANGAVTWSSDAALQLFLPGSDGRLRLGMDMVHPDDRNEVFEMVQALRSGRTRFARGTWRLRGADGDWSLVDTAAVDRTKDPAINGYVITTRTLPESMSDPAADSYSLVARCAIDGYWEWNLQTDLLHLSPEWLATVGWGDADRCYHSAEWFDSVHPEDRDALMASIRAHLEGNAARLLNEHRVMSGSGTWAWVEIRGVAERDGQGKAARMVGSLTDIAHTKLTDTLTGLPNGMLLMDRLGHLLSAARRDPQLFAVLVLDLDRHPVVRESLGHKAGDEMLKHVARRLERTLRPGDTVARLGQARFGVLLDDIRDDADAQRVTERLHAALAEPIQVEGQEVFTTASIGIAMHTHSDETPEDLLNAAETAMRRARSSSEDRSAYFDRGMHDKARARLELETDLRRAVDAGSFELHYQPIVDLVDARVVGFEGLIRWDHKSRGMVSPAMFIPISEETGLIVPIGRWVLKEACRQLRAWVDEHPGADELLLSVNVSGREFDQPDLADRILATIEEVGLFPGQLKLEITETAIIRSPETAVAVLTRLKDAGIKLALDDFGTGYSSLSYLHRLPFDTIKIDRSFINEIGGDGQSPVIVRTILNLAESLGMEVIAEGIETADQWAVLKELGCQFGQGWHFGRPVPALKAQQLLVRKAS